MPATPDMLEMVSLVTVSVLHMLLRSIIINAVLASGSGSGELACKCNRSVECSIEGKLTGQSEA